MRTAQWHVVTPHRRLFVQAFEVVLFLIRSDQTLT